MTKLPDGSGFFILEIDGRNPDEPIKWNPGNKVVQDHRDGTIHYERTNIERAKRGLPVPWTIDMTHEVFGPDIP